MSIRVREPNAVTIKDVARLAEVSPTVVSRVLHNKANAIRVSEPTAIRVRNAAEELGYKINVLARNFRAQQTYSLGVLHGFGPHRPKFGGVSRYFAELMDGVLDSAFELGFSITFCPNLYGSSPGDAMDDGRFDGLVWYSTSPSEENWRLVTECRLPIALIHSPSSEYGSRYPAVVCDNDLGLKLAVEHLMGLGHEMIAIAVDSNDFFNEAQVRIDSFFKAKAELGLVSREDDLILISPDEAEVHAFMSDSCPYTAVIGVSDTVAARFLSVAPKHGRVVPRDLSVIGFDSTVWCDSLTPALTSVRQPLYMMGRQAVELLVKRIQTAIVDPTTFVVPCGLDIRGSTASAKSSR